MALHPKQTKQMKELEAKIGPLRVKGAYMLLALELRETAEGGPTTVAQVAEELKVSTVTLWNWKNNRDFITYKNLIADTFLEEKRAIVNQKLMSLIDSSQPSVKAIDLYFRRFGLLTERQIVEQVESQDVNTSNEKIEESMAEIDELLEKKEGE
ncbi:phBC6A51 family helix-turn-helix protein [Psychrobacillus sp. FSL K6-2365]|uniref:phBC6A51 family helix-turn-helix protein n=1 Tax=Psychrobacillus sp. FSL K6-2365 TaxID=2921546 RepID=UPI0030FBD443